MWQWVSVDIYWAFQLILNINLAPDRLSRSTIEQSDTHCQLGWLKIVRVDLSWLQLLNTQREDKVGDIIARRKLWHTWRILSRFDQSHLVTPRDSGMNNLKLRMKIDTTVKPVVFGRQSWEQIVQDLRPEAQIADFYIFNCRIHHTV